MVENSDNNGIIELWGRVFAKAKGGLDEEQIQSFLYELISECHLLTRRQEQLSLFSQLAERDESYSGRSDI